MNNKRKESALKTFSAMLAEGKSYDEVLAAIKESDKGYTEEEQKEIYDALVNGETKTDSPIKTYEKWLVADEGNSKYRKRELLGTSKMEQRHADALNAQTANSGERYYEI